MSIGRYLKKFKDIVRKVVVLNKGRESNKSKLLETIEIVRAHKRLKTTTLFKSLYESNGIKPPAPRKSIVSNNSGSDKPSFKPLARGEFETLSTKTQQRKSILKRLSNN